MSISELNAHGRSQFQTYIIVPIIELLATLLRFWCKVESRAGIKADDWCLLTAVACQFVAKGVCLWGLLAGSHGRSVDQIAVAVLHGSPSDVRRLGIYLEGQYITFHFDVTTLFFIRISLCLMYRRIFSTPRYRTATLALLGVTTLWYIATIIALLAACIPVDYFWNRDQPGHCLNFNLFLLIDGTLETVIDITILALPIWAVSRLNMSGQNRVLVSGVFLLGGFSIITNLLRVVFSFNSQPHEEFVALDDSEFWYNVHACTAIICASLPIYKPLVHTVIALLTTIRSYYGSSSEYLRFRFGAARLRFGGKLRPQTGDPGVDRIHYGNKAYAMHELQIRTVHQYLPSAEFISDSTSDLILRPGAAMHSTTYIINNNGPTDGEMSDANIRRATEVSVV